MDGITNLADNIEDRLTEVIDKLDKGTSYGHISFWIIFVIALLTIIITGFVWFIVYR